MGAAGAHGEASRAVATCVLTRCWSSEEPGKQTGAADGMEQQVCPQFKHSKGTLHKLLFEGKLVPSVLLLRP